MVCLETEAFSMGWKTAHGQYLSFLVLHRRLPSGEPLERTLFWSWTGVRSGTEKEWAMCGSQGSNCSLSPQETSCTVCSVGGTLGTCMTHQLLNSPVTYQHLCFSFDMFYWDRAFLYSLGRPGTWYVAQAGSSFEITGMHTKSSYLENVVFYS